jgi:hypothetical protein
MNSYHEIERFQRKTGQADFLFRDTGTPAHEHRETPAPGDEEAQDAALERFASLLQARHRREVEQDHPEAGDEQPLKQLLRRIAVGPGETNERWPTRC